MTSETEPESKFDASLDYWSDFEKWKESGLLELAEREKKEQRNYSEWDSENVVMLLGVWYKFSSYKFCRDSRLCRLEKKEWTDRLSNVLPGSVPNLFQGFPHKIRCSRVVALNAVACNGNCLEYVGAHLKSDFAAVGIAVLSCPGAIKFAADEVKTHPTILKLAGLWQEKCDQAKEIKAILSVKYGFAATASPFSTEVAATLNSHHYFWFCEIYNPNAFCKDSCDPDFTNFEWPCRGDAITCGLHGTLDGATPTLNSCWRYSFRYHQQICYDSWGFMIQVEEGGGLGAGQKIETAMAAEVGLKVFRICQHYDDVVFKRGFTMRQADLLASEVEKWYEGDCEDSSLVEIRLWET